MRNCGFNYSIRKMLMMWKKGHFMMMRGIIIAKNHVSVFIHVRESVFVDINGTVKFVGKYGDFKT